MARLRYKKVPRPHRSDVVPARNSTSTCSGAITSVLNVDTVGYTTDVARIFTMAVQKEASYRT